jgi:hypothetical protein
MVLNKNEAITELLLAKSVLRSSCLKKCLDAKGESPILSSGETQCLQNCAYKLKDYLELARESYLKSHQ